MPLFAIDFPENAKALFSILIGITTFDIFPSESLDEVFFEF